MGVDAGFTQPCTPAARRGRGELLSTAFSPPSARTQALSSAPRAPRRRAPRRSGLLLRTKRANPWHFVPKIVEGRSAAAARNVHGEVREALLPCRSHRFPHYSWSSSAWVYVQSENHPQRGTFFAPDRRGALGPQVPWSAPGDTFNHTSTPGTLFLLAHRPGRRRCNAHSPSRCRPIGRRSPRSPPCLE